MTTTNLAPGSTSATRVVTTRPALARAFQTADPLDALVLDLAAPNEQGWNRVVDALNGTDLGELHVVALSAVGTEQPDSSFLRTLAAREDVIRQACPAATVLRLAPFVEELAVYSPLVSTGATVYHGYGDGDVAWLRAAHVPPAVAQATRRPGATLALSGPRTATVADVFRAWGAKLGHSAEIVPLPEAVFSEHLEALGLKSMAAAIVAHNEWVGSVPTSSVTDSELFTRLTGHQISDPRQWNPAPPLSTH